MREFCWTCHRPIAACFCAMTRPFSPSVDFALVVHPYEARSTIGTAWILRRSIPNLKWIRSNGFELDQDLGLREVLSRPDSQPLLLFPGARSFNLNLAQEDAWKSLVPPPKKPLFIVVDGTWTQARATLRRSALLRSLPRVSFETTKLSEYGFKRQPHPKFLSCVEGVHRVIEVLASRGWGKLPSNQEHDQMIEIFRHMVRFQAVQERRPRSLAKDFVPKLKESESAKTSRTLAAPLAPTDETPP